MEAEFECTIDVAEDGLIKVFATDGKLGDGCIERIGLLTRETQVGDIVEGRVASTTSFGAFVTLKPGTDGLVHISRLADHRVATVEDVVNRGDLVRVEVLEVQMQGGKEKISLQTAREPLQEGRLVSSDEYRLEHLPNGQRLVTERLDHLRSVCLGFWIPAGSRDEPAPARRRHAFSRTPPLQGVVEVHGGRDRPDLRHPWRGTERQHLPRVRGRLRSLP